MGYRGYYKIYEIDDVDDDVYRKREFIGLKHGLSFRWVAYKVVCRMSFLSYSINIAPVHPSCHPHTLNRGAIAIACNSCDNSLNAYGTCTFAASFASRLSSANVSTMFFSLFTTEVNPH